MPAIYRSVVEGQRVAGVRRLVVVGGASGQGQVDEPDFPAMDKAESLALRKVLTFRHSEPRQWSGEDALVCATPSTLLPARV